MNSTVLKWIGFAVGTALVAVGNRCGSDLRWRDDKDSAGLFSAIGLSQSMFFCGTHCKDLGRPFLKSAT